MTATGAYFTLEVTTRPNEGTEIRYAIISEPQMLFIGDSMTDPRERVVYNFEVWRANATADTMEETGAQLRYNCTGIVAEITN